MGLREVSGGPIALAKLPCCIKAKNRKTSPELSRQMNSGAGNSARGPSVSCTSGLPNMSSPTSGGGTSNDQSATEKQNQ